jgi:hypothetical protein
MSAAGRSSCRGYADNFATSQIHGRGRADLRLLAICKLREAIVMNKLPKLFGARVLAATVGTGMLLHAAVALATHCNSQSTTASPPEGWCSNGVMCYGPGPGGETLYWCCPIQYACDLIPGDSPWQGTDGNWYGWCDCT